MQPTLQQIAEAFSTHNFEQVFPYLATDAMWDNVGGEHIEGRDAVMAACRESAGYLSGVNTTFKGVSSLTGDDHVIVESVAEYNENGELSTVAACDIYEFEGGHITTITSYNIELASPQK